MPDQESRMEAMLFDYRTTYRTDFHHGHIVPQTPTLYKEKPTCMKIRPPPLKDQHTLTAWKNNIPVPFSLMHKPRLIVGTDPNKVQQPFVQPEDTEKEKVIKTRPRLVMTPAVSMDDIEDKRARQVLCESMYTTNTSKANKEAVAKYFTVKAPLPGLPAPANPITLPPFQFPYVSPEWRMETISWDRKQLRSFCDPTKEFWLGEDLPPCRSCKETKIMEAHRKRICQTKFGG